MLLKFVDVSFSYGEQTILSKANLTIQKGDFVFFVGKSGIGKSTVFELIYMNIKPSSGFIEFENFNSQKIKKRNLPYLRRKIGIIFQDFKLLPDRTVYENLEFSLRVTDCPSKEIKRRIINSLSDVGLLHKSHFIPSQLSGGEQQRVSIARAIINEPQLILADEPTGNLDPETSNEIIKILFNINKRGAAVLFATHNYDIVRKNLTRAKIIKLDNYNFCEVPKINYL